ncbi:MAG: polyprenyl synthetase family protein [Planctomycetes bacterium]|nr:polyprenyl synthetase family protein [Planctomycetota bacterium]
MDPQLAHVLSRLTPEIEAALEAHFPPQRGALGQCMRYATFSGGRRMRPVLCLLGADFCNVKRQHALPLAAAIEFLHTASLIYDDLPAMDNAVHRRGQPPAHADFGQGVALLAGLSLVSHAFGLLAPYPALVELASRCVGDMSSGQAIDLHGGDRSPRHYLKTTALFRLALTAAGTATNAEPGNLQALEAFATHFGTAYQLMDDADDEGAGQLAAQSASELALAQAALQPYLGNSAARNLSDYARQVLHAVASIDR